MHFVEVLWARVINLKNRHVINNLYRNNAYCFKRTCCSSGRLNMCSLPDYWVLYVINDRRYSKLSTVLYNNLNSVKTDTLTTNEVKQKTLLDSNKCCVKSITSYHPVTSCFLLPICNSVHTKYILFPEDRILFFSTDRVSFKDIQILLMFKSMIVGAVHHQGSSCKSEKQLEYTLKDLHLPVIPEQSKKTVLSENEHYGPAIDQLLYAFNSVENAGSVGKTDIFAHEFKSLQIDEACNQIDFNKCDKLSGLTSKNHQLPAGHGDNVLAYGGRRYSVPVETPKEPKKPAESGDEGPSLDKLQHVFNVLQQTLPKLFVQIMDYTIYDHNIVFEDNIRRISTKGIFWYMYQVSLLRLMGHLKFAYVRFEILKITLHENDKTVKVRWRIRGISGLKIFYSFWKYRILNMQDSINQNQETWIDGFSIYYIGSNGLVYKHEAHKLIPEDTPASAESKQGPLAAKLS